MSRPHLMAWRTLIWMLAFAVLTLPVVAIVNGWIGSEHWPLRTLRINNGLQRVDLVKVRQTVLPYVDQGYFAIRLPEAQQALEQLPWVERVQLRKHWPDVLEIHIDEHQPLAWWGSEQVLSEHGPVFPLANIALPDHLPHLYGPDNRTQEIIAFYHHADAVFASTGIGVEQVLLDAHGNWQVTLSSGTSIMIGRHEAPSRLQRFARVMPLLLAGRSALLQRADLRYPNGFAVVWGET